MNGFQQALEHACNIASLDPEGARLLRLGSNAVYHLKAPVIARIARPGTDLDHVSRTVAVARWLEAEHYPAVRVIDIDQPLIADGYVVTFWRSLSDDGDQFAATPEIAAVLAKLHHLAAPEALHLPSLDPFAKATDRIEASTWLTPQDHSFLTETLARLQDAYAVLKFNLPQGVIHGDANVGNVLRDRDGTPVLIDLDGFAIGPREWDLILTAIYYDSFGWHTKQEYEDFARAYGYDVMQWPGYPVLREIREFLMVTWLIQKARKTSRQQPRHPGASATCAPARAARTGSPTRPPRRTAAGRAAIRHSRDCSACSSKSRTAAVPSATTRCSRNSRK